jgi:hypothetical protein
MDEEYSAHESHETDSESSSKTSGQIKSTTIVTDDACRSRAHHV